MNLRPSKISKPAAAGNHADRSGATRHPKETYLYFESHITIEPVFGDDQERASVIAREFGFRLADLLMRRRKEDTPSRSKFDTFMTTRATKFQDISERTQDCVRKLQENGFAVWRYKIEDTLVDSKTWDEFELLVTQPS